MSTFLNCSFFSQKDLASSFLTLEDALSLATTGSVGRDLEGTLTRVLEVEQQLKDWKTKVENCYFNAFEQSGKTLDFALEKRNFHELKNVVQSRESLRLFCVVLNETTNPALTKSVQKRQPTSAARDLKKQRQTLSLQNQSLITSLLNAREDLLLGLTRAKTVLKESIESPSLVHDLTELEQRKKALLKNLDDADKEGMRLMDARKLLGTTQGALQESIESEKSEIVSLKQQLSFAKQDILSKQEQHRFEEQKHLRVLHGLHLMSHLFEKISGVQFQHLSGTEVAFRLSNGQSNTTQNQSIEVILCFDPNTMFVSSIRLSPDLGVSTEAVKGLTVQSAVNQIRRMVFEQHQKNQ